MGSSNRAEPPNAAPNLARASAVEGWMRTDELAFLQELAHEVGDGGVVVEVGSWKGRSTVAICEALAATNDVRVWAVDTFAGDALIAEASGIVRQEDVLAEFRRNTAGFDQLRVVVGDSAESAVQFADASVDWVFLDADHSYEAVARDIAAWAPKVKPGGLFSGHDFGRFGVTEAVLRSFGPVSVRGTVWYTRRRPRRPAVVALRRRAAGVRARVLSNRTIRRARLRAQ